MRLLVLLLLVGGSLPAQKSIAIYRDKGVWPSEGHFALPVVIEWLGHRWQWIDGPFIEGGGLRKNGKNVFDLLVVPGGWAPDYFARVGGWNGAGRGDDEIRAFVANGGGYLGFCAGAFAAASTARWLNRTYAYPWRLFDGRAEGPLPWNKLRPGGFLRAGHGTAVLDLTAPQLAGRGLSAVVRPMLYGGPRLVLRDPRRPPPGYRVLAKHGEDGSASILSFRYASASGGWVVLSSFHPSVLTDDGAALDRDHDDYRWAGGGADPDGAREDWKLAAALVEIALGLPVQKAPPLPRAAGSVTVPAVLPLGQTTLLPLSQPSSPGAVYVLLASASVVPGVPLGDDVWLPLTFDVLLQMSLQVPSVFQSFVGTLDGQGRATAKLALPALPALRGLPFEFAFVTRGATRWLAASAPAGGVTQ